MFVLLPCHFMFLFQYLLICVGREAASKSRVVVYIILMCFCMIILCLCVVQRCLVS
jgi:hypothetical protein